MRKLKLLIGAVALCGAFAAYACNNIVTLTCWTDGQQVGWDSPYDLGLSTCTTETHIFAVGTVSGPVSTITTLSVGYDDAFVTITCNGTGEIYDNCLFTYHTINITANAGDWHVPVGTSTSCDNRL